MVHRLRSSHGFTSLRILKLWGELYLSMLDGCTFELDSFECAYLGDCSAFPKFLDTQPSLKYVNFGSTISSSLEATCLPNLTWVNATLSWLPYLIPGRPVNEVITFGGTLYNDSIDLSFFALSTTPIQKLTIDYSHLSLTPGHLLASFLPSLTHFTLTAWKSTSFLAVCGLPSY